MQLPGTLPERHIQKKSFGVEINFFLIILSVSVTTTKTLSPWLSTPSENTFPCQQTGLVNVKTLSIS
jgi:hypothetical protein